MRKPFGLPALVVGVALVAAGPVARAQAPSFVAEVERNQIGVGDSFTYQVTLNAANESIDGYQAPNFGSLRVASAPRGPNRSTQMQIGGGGTFVQNGYTWQYQLVGNQKGALSIGPARVRVDGREMKSNTVNVRIVDAGAAPRPAPQRSRSPFAGIPGFGDPEPDPEPEPAREPEANRSPALSSAPAANFIRAVPDKTKAFVGEMVTVSWFLYLSTRADQFNPVTEPHTDGFWAEDITPPNPTGHLHFQNETIAGRSYQVALLSRKALFPLQPGKLTVTSMESDISQVDFFGSSLRRQRLKTDPVIIEAVPLPKAGQPADFDAASVGKFTLSAHVDRNTVGVGDAVTLTVELKGQGNLRNLRVPPLPALDGWKAYPPKTNLALDSGGERVTGTKSTEYLLLPERPGTTMVTSLALLYFDPETKTYAVAKTDPLRLEVTGDASAVAHAGGAPATVPGAATSPAGAGNENVIAAEIRPIRAQATLTRDIGATFYRSSGFVGLLLIPPLGLLLTAVAGRVRVRLSGDTERTRRRRARTLARKRLSAAEQHRDGGRTGDFYIEIDRVLRDQLASRLGQSVAGLRMDELSARLRARGMADEAAARVIAELEECDLARFAPGAGGVGRERMTASLERAAELIEAIEKAPLRAEPAG
jgi:hypothetical protein